MVTYYDSQIMDMRYQIFRCDRDRAGSGRRDGGGVLVAVRRGLGATPLVAPPGAPPPSPIIDQVLLQLRFRDSCWVVSAAYIPTDIH